MAEKETVDDDSQGVALATVQDLAACWATDYDWSRCETRLNSLPNFVTEIDGLDIHFIARLYWENKADFFDAKPITHPVCHQRVPRRALPSAPKLG
jgi:hypothetical protein